MAAVPLLLLLLLLVFPLFALLAHLFVVHLRKISYKFLQYGENIRTFW